MHITANGMPARKSLKAHRRGAIAVLAAFLMVVMLAVMAFAIDIGMIGNSRTDLQRAADAGAIAAAGELVKNPGNEATVARQFAKLNPITTQALLDSEITVQTGSWDRTTRVFSAGAEPADAVRVLTQKSNNSFFFAPVLGANQYNMQASAVATFQPRDIMLVLDYSGSMLDENKINSLKQSVNLFCNLVRQTSQGKDRVGFVRYSTTATLERGLTFDVAQINRAAQAGSASGFTNIGDAMHLATRELELNGRPRAKKLMVLLTDGLANRPTTRDPIAYVRQEADSAANHNYPIVAVSFGSDADQTLMAYAGRVTRGVHFHVQGNGFASQESQLQDVFRRVAVNRSLQLVD